MPRQPRFKRAPDAPSLHLTSRDLAIFQHVARHRFLNSQQIVALVGGSNQHVLKRLQRLYHSGYLDRPRAQVRYFSEDGSQPIAYALARKGARALAEPNRQPPRYDNRNVKQLYLQHTLLVADVVIAFTRACQSPPAPRLLMEEDLAPAILPTAAFRWAVTVRRGDEAKRVGVVPDRVLVLESPATKERILYFIEADRATMPVKRRSLLQSSMLRKLLAYEATWKDAVHRERFGCQRFRVLVVTSSAERAHHLAALAAQLPRGRGLFLFTDADALRGKVFPHVHETILELPWLTATGTTERLVDTFVEKKTA